MEVLANAIKKQAVISAHAELIKALHGTPKRIPSKFIYDLTANQDPEHVLTGQSEILKRNTRAILRAAAKDAKLNIIELGSGHGFNTSHFMKGARSLKYQVTLAPFSHDPENNLAKLPLMRETNNLVLYLDSRVGQYSPDEQVWFLSRLSRMMGPGDFLLMGFDLKKDPDILREAPDPDLCPKVINHLNRELGGDFKVENFRSEKIYVPTTGALEHWLISTKPQVVHLKSPAETFQLRASEGIHVDTAWKFSTREIRKLARCTGFNSVHKFTDKRGWYVNELWSAENVKQMYQS